MKLDKDELEILQDDQFLPLKARVCQKVEEQLAGLLPQLRRLLWAYDLGPYPEVAASSGKISKGENYRSFAYRVLDYPNVLTKEDMFLFRSMMLWGDAYSFHFVLAGKYLEAFRDQILTHATELPTDLLLACHDDPWLWHAKAEGWKRVGDWEQGDWDKEIQKRKFIKLSSFLSLRKYEEVEEKAKELLRTYLEILFVGA